MPPSVLSSLAVAAATLVSEDLTTIGTGLLAADGRIGLGLGIVACAVGIWVGDVGLWLVGRFAGSHLRRIVSSTSHIAPGSVADLRDRFVRSPGVFILASRFLPGTRLPLYLAASSLGVSLPAFASWSAIAVAIWTPVVVGVVAWLGGAVATPLRAYLGAGWLIGPVAVGLVWQGKGIRRSAVRVIDRARRWEFWPSWIFYAPVALWVGWLMLRRGPRALTAANPGLEDGGFVGESKAAILEKLPADSTLGFCRVAEARPQREDAGPSDSVGGRLAQVRVWMHRTGVSFPIIMKPDVGQRGVGVKLVRSAADAAAYLAAQPAALIAQVYHPGPYEAGIFYYRLPGQSCGRIFSITDKRFPAVVGDGTSSLEALILQHPRYRLQAATFLVRHRAALRSIPPAGRSVPLGITGNHAQGALFLDGADLETEALAARIDAIARSVGGFYIGRFDVRYRDPRRLMAGEDLAIVELNGVTAEATHIYDPSHSLLDAYRTLRRQWSLVFEIGSINLQRGCRAASIGRLLRLSTMHLTTRSAATASD